MVILRVVTALVVILSIVSMVRFPQEVTPIQPLVTGLLAVLAWKGDGL